MAKFGDVWQGEGEKEWTNLKSGDAVVDVFEDVILGHGQEVIDGRDVVHGVRQDPDLKIGGKV